MLPFLRFWRKGREKRLAFAGISATIDAIEDRDRSGLWVRELEKLKQRKNHSTLRHTYYRSFLLLVVIPLILVFVVAELVIGYQIRTAAEEKAPAQQSAEADPAALEGELVFAIWDNNLMTYIEENDMVGKFQQVYPNAEIEVEKIKDDSEYWNAMKMRASANQLPDVMFNKPFTPSRFQDYLLDLSDAQAAKNNTLAAGYALDGKILGIPMTAGYEYVFYWKDMFEEAGVEAPTTWEDLKNAATTLQEHFGASDPDFMAIALGAKDEWPDYPYMEFMPALVGGNGQNWNDMAATDTPFAEGSDINTAYHRVYDLFTSGVFGKDPLGLGNDQATNLFAQKKAAIIALGDWGLQNIEACADSIDQLGTFYLPVSLDESALLDGCSYFQLFVRIIFPLLAPATATVAIIKAITIINDMYIPYLYMPGNKLRTLTTFLMDYANAQQGSWQTLAAGIVLIMLPTIVIYIFFQRYILAGVAAGAVKE